jgi:hypothetical protein
MGDDPIAAGNESAHECPADATRRACDQHQSSGRHGGTLATEALAVQVRPRHLLSSLRELRAGHETLVHTAVR